MLLEQLYVKSKSMKDLVVYVPYHPVPRWNGHNNNFRYLSVKFADHNHASPRISEMLYGGFRRIALIHFTHSRL
jgi:hypothetical protein